MIVFGGFTECGVTPCESGEAAAYDPRRDRWRSLADWEARWIHSAVWTGREMIVWGGDGFFEYEANGAAYRPRVDRWRPLPRGPLEARAAHSAVWAGKRMLVWGGCHRADGAAYAP